MNGEPRFVISGMKWVSVKKYFTNSNKSYSYEEDILHITWFFFRFILKQLPYNTVSHLS